MMTKTVAIALVALNYISVSAANAADYQQRSPQPGTIHTVKITKGWCGNLAISTKVGHLVSGHCKYDKETNPDGYDGCTQYLHGGLLEAKVGKGFDCAAVHIHSRVTGSDVVNEFILITNGDGHYIDSKPSISEVQLKE